MLEGYDSFRVKIEAQKKRNASISRGKAVVSSVSKWATQFAIDILKEGGNAFDASFALAFGLALFHPQAGNIGGGGYLVYFKQGWKSPRAINYREIAPLSMDVHKYLNEKGEVDPEKSSFGPMSICTPGTVKAFYKLHSSYGKIPSKRILKRLSEYARSGYPLTQYQVECLNRLSPKLAYSPESKKIYVKKTGKYKAGDIFKNIDLARTFELLGELGEDVFYTGEIARAIDEDIKQNNGFLSYMDLKAYEVKEVEPIHCEINGKRIWTVPPEGGGAVLINLLNILDNEKFKSLKVDSIDYYHGFAQASKASFINRQGYMGDIPLENNEYYKRVFYKDFWNKIYGHFGDGDLPTDEVSNLLGNPIGQNGYIEMKGGSNTTHFSVIDNEGNAVSNSYTLNLRYGSKWSVKEYGFLLNGSMDAFSFRPGIMNYFGVMGNKANLAAPGKRPASSMSPVIITDEKGVLALLGTPGGPTIPTTIANIIWPFVTDSIKDYSYLIERGRLHHQAWPDVLFVERNCFSEAIIDSFNHLGYTVKFKDEPIGDVHAIFKDNDKFIGISDYRREGMTLSIG